MSETTEAAEGYGGDIGAAELARLDRWMRAEIADVDALTAVDRFVGGQSNPTFGVTAGGRKFVLRRKPPGDLLSSAHAVEREYAVMKALGTTDFPVPRVHGLCEDPSVIGSAFYIMEFLDGRILWDPKLPDSAPHERRAIYESQIDTLAALHRIDPVEIGLADFGRPGNYFTRQLSRWTKQYRLSAAPQQPEMEWLIEWLPRNVPADTAPRIVHGDYRIDNMVLAPSGPEIIGVLDWELCTLGDPLADLTYYLMIWHMPPDERASLATVDFTTSGIPSWSQGLERYVEATGATLDRPIEWYIAFNLFRLAAILQGVAGRAARGQANNERALRAQERVGPLARAAWMNAQIAGAGS